MDILEYNLATNRLVVNKLRETASIDKQLISSVTSSIQGVLVEEPTFVNRIELYPNGDLHVFGLDERTPYLFMNAILAKGTITFSGNNVFIDSYDSADPLYPAPIPDGLHDPSQRKDNAIILTSSSLDNALSIGNATIVGYVGTNNSASVFVDANGSVGDIAWYEAGQKGIQEGHYVQNYFVQTWQSGELEGEIVNPNLLFTSISLPYASGVVPTGGTVGSIVYDYILDQPIDYFLTTLEGRMYVSAKCRLVVTDEVKILGSDYIRIVDGGRLRLYNAGTNGIFGGQGVINETNQIANFTYYGTDSNTQISFAGESVFYGGVIAPDATITIGGGGSSYTEFFGWIVANVVVLQGATHFHYDENVRRVTFYG